MKLLADSSALAKRYVLENGSEILDQFLLKTSELAVCIILIPEIISGLNRRLREKNISAYEYSRLKKQLINDMNDATVLHLTPSV